MKDRQEKLAIFLKTEPIYIRIIKKECKLNKTWYVSLVEVSLIDRPVSMSRITETLIHISTKKLNKRSFLNHNVLHKSQNLQSTNSFLILFFITFYLICRKRVFILGPSHHVNLNGCDLTGCSYYSTPFYDLEVDKAGKIWTFFLAVNDNVHNVLYT